MEDNLEEFQISQHSSPSKTSFTGSQYVAKSLCKYIIKKTNKKINQTKRQRVINSYTNKYGLLYSNNCSQKIKQFYNYTPSETPQLQKQEGVPKVFKGSSPRKIKMMKRVPQVNFQAVPSLRSQPTSVRSSYKKSSVTKINSEAHQLVKLDSQKQIDDEKNFIQQMRQKKQKTQKFQEIFLRKTFKASCDHSLNDEPVITNFLGQRITLNKQIKKDKCSFRYAKVRATVRELRQTAPLKTSQSIYSSSKMTTQQKENLIHETEQSQEKYFIPETNGLIRLRKAPLKVIQNSSTKISSESVSQLFGESGFRGQSLVNIFKGKNKVSFNNVL